MPWYITCLPVYNDTPLRTATRIFRFCFGAYLHFSHFNSEIQNTLLNGDQNNFDNPNRPKKGKAMLNQFQTKLWNKGTVPIFTTGFNSFSPSS